MESEDDPFGLIKPSIDANANNDISTKLEVFSNKRKPDEKNLYWAQKRERANSARGRGPQE